MVVMDPLSVVSGAVGLAKTAVSIIQLVGSLRDAPEVLDELVENLKSLEIALDRLADIDGQSQATGQEEHGPNDMTKQAVKGCERVLNRISKDLNPLHEQMQQGMVWVAWATVKTVVKESSIKDDIARLDSTKINLVVAMAVDERYSSCCVSHA